MDKVSAKIALFGFYTMFMAACAGDQLDQPHLFSIDSLLAGQASYLSDNGATLRKVMTLNDAREEISLTPKDAASWKRELEIFEALEIINKPINMDLYRSAYISDAKSNLSIKAITTDADLPVEYMKIYYQNDPDRIRKIEAAYHESNTLYHSKRHLTLEFTEVGNTAVLTAYSVEGGQKMVLSDSVIYSINGALTISN
jgi:hypothetical protein